MLFLDSFSYFLVDFRIQLMKKTRCSSYYFLEMFKLEAYILIIGPVIKNGKQLFIATKKLCIGKSTKTLSFYLFISAVNFSFFFSISLLWIGRNFREVGKQNLRPDKIRDRRRPTRFALKTFL